MNIARATTDDLENLSVMFDQYRQFYDQESDIASAKAFLLERISRNESVLFVAREEGGARTLLGFTQLYPSFSSVRLKRLWVLNDLFVATAARRKGVAEALLTQAVDFARESGARGLTLKTALENIPAQYLYEKMGWRRDTKFCNFDFKV